MFRIKATSPKYVFPGTMNKMEQLVSLEVCSLSIRLAAISGEGAEQSGAPRAVPTVADHRDPPQVSSHPPPVQSQSHLRGSARRQTEPPEDLRVVDHRLRGAGPLCRPGPGSVCLGMVPRSGPGAPYAHPTGLVQVLRIFSL